MPLHREVTRCHAHDCIDRQNCLRFMERATGQACTPHEPTLRPDADQPCLYQLKPAAPAPEERAAA